MNTNEPAATCPNCKATIPEDAPRGLCPGCVLARAATATGASPGPGGTEEAPSIASVGTAFPQLEVLELIGRGGMGFVYKARQPHLDRFVALKLLPDRLARDAQFTERFNREGRVLGKLNHPNIVSVYDFGRADAFYFLLMEYVDGVNLRQAMQAGRFSPAEALGIVPRICEALQYAHEQGVLHRDIKPENILIDARGRVKIADFGIAKLVGEVQAPFTLTATGASLGTPHYMAPEQLESPGAVDQRADIYSLGVVFYEMLTGELPIGRFAPPSEKTPVGSALDEVVFRTLEKDREKRYRSAEEVRTRVEQLAANPQAEKEAGDVPRENPVDDGLAERRGYAFRAIAGASLVGVSWVAPLSTVVALLTHRGGVGPGELWLSLGSVALPGIGGTLVGWLGLNDIRESGGRLKGLPLALFATLAWPLAALAALAVGVPLFVLAPAGPPSLARSLGRILLVFLPAGVFTFSLWSVYSTARWALRRPAPTERGVLKWIFAGLLMLGFAWVLMTRTGPSLASPRSENAVAGTGDIGDWELAGDPLPDGVVELAAVWEGTAGHAWRPDGSPYTEQPFDDLRSSDWPGDNRRAVDFVALCHEPAQDDPELLVTVPGAAWLTSSSASRRGESIPGSLHVRALLPTQLEQTRLLAKVASGPWRSLAVETNSGGGVGSLVSLGKHLTAIFLTAVEDSAGNTVVTVTRSTPSHQRRIVAITRDGEERAGLITSANDAAMAVTFPNLRRGRIREFQFQVRPYRWIEFKEVQLRPRSAPPG